MKDLTISNIERQNILNNRFAIEHIQKTLDITGMMFDGEYRSTKKMVADFYEKVNTVAFFLFPVYNAVTILFMEWEKCLC